MGVALRPGATYKRRVAPLTGYAPRASWETGFTNPSVAREVVSRNRLNQIRRPLKKVSGVVSANRARNETILAAIFYSVDVTLD